MLEAILSFVAGFILCDFLTYLRYKKATTVEETVDVQTEAKRVLIEHHSDCFFAYSDNNEFLGQNTSLIDLAMHVMKDDPSVILAASDEFVIAELRKLVSSQQ